MSHRGSVQRRSKRREAGPASGRRGRRPGDRGWQGRLAGPAGSGGAAGPRRIPRHDRGLPPFVSLFRDAIDPADPERTKALFAGHDVPGAGGRGDPQRLPGARRRRAGGRALLGHRRGPARPVVRGPAGHLPQHPRRRRLLDAVKRCWASLWNPRAVAYRDEHGVSHDDVALAVVVQELVPADASGVLFTADPVTGSRTETVINASWGLGEAVVGGEVTPDTVTVARGVVTRATHRRQDGHDGPHRGRDRRPGRARRAARRPVLDEDRPSSWPRGRAGSGAVRRADGRGVGPARRRVRDRAGPPDHRPPPQVEEWNDSLKGEYLWTAGNFGEAIPDVMTPITWSFVQLFIHEAMSASAFPGFDMVGNIGGRFYMNLTPVYAMAKAVRVKSWSARSRASSARSRPASTCRRRRSRWETCGGPCPRRSASACGSGGT